MPGSPDEDVLDYLRSGERMPMREMLTWTFRMCWLPFALRLKGADDSAVQIAALDAVNLLENHAYFMRQTFGLERSQLVHEPVNFSSNGRTVDHFDDISPKHLVEEFPGEYDLTGLGFAEFDDDRFAA